MLRKQVEDLAAELAVERQQAEAPRDRCLLDRLVDIRSAEADDRGGWSTDAAYADAFRDAGLDVAALSAAEATERIRARPPEVVTALATAMDDWAAIRRDRRRTAPARRHCRRWPAPPTPTPGAIGLRRALDLPDPAARLEALRRLAEAATVDTLGPISLDLLGRALKDAGDPSGAEAVLRRAQRRHPGDVWLNYDLARALEKLARREEAIRYYTAARSIRPETAHELAHTLGAKGETDEEIAIFEDLRRLRPGNGRHLGCLGRALKNQGRLPEAAAILEAAAAANREAIRLRPDDAHAHFSLGFALACRGSWMRRSQSIAPPSASSPTTPPSTTTSASSWATRGSWMRRSPSTAPPSASSPTSPTPTTRSATSCTGSSRITAAAAAEFREAIRLRPDFAFFHNNLGFALQRQGELDKAIAEYRIASRLQPDSVDIHVGIAEILEFQGKWAEAIVEYRTALQLRPDFADAHNGVAWALARTPDCSARERSEALEHARRAVALSPKEGSFRTTLALAEYRAGHWAESIAAAEQSIALTKGVDASNGFFLAMALWRRGEKDRSRSSFEQAVAWTKKNDPEHANLLAFWREAAELLDQPGPIAWPASRSARQPVRPMRR